MVMNPVMKPKVATVPLVLVSMIVLAALALFLGYVSIVQPPLPVSTLIGSILLTAVLILGGRWWKRVTQHRGWLVNASERWRAFNDAKLASGTTTEVTLLSVDAVQPTGSWVTIRWNRFNHIQPAWIEALPEPIWPGSVLLIAPDPAQVMPGTPWPDVYYIRAGRCLASAPSAGRPASP
jgi:hypothetical protein